MEQIPKPWRMTKPRRTIVRWIRSRNQRRYEWQHAPTYWISRRRWTALQLSALGRRVNVENYISQQRTASQLLTGILRLTVSQFIRASILVALMGFADRHLFSDSPAQPGKRFTLTFFDWLPDAISSFAIDPSAATSLLSTLIQIAGVFVGLYFAAVSPVFSTYARGSNEARNELVDEMINNGYISLIGLFGAIGTLVLGRSAFGSQIGPVTVAFALVLGIVAILSFVPLSIRTFYLHDPANLGQYLPGKLHNWVSAAARSDRVMRQPALQNYYSRRASALMLVQSSILKLAIDRESSESATSRLLIRELRMLQWYTRTKPRIPTKCGWFPNTPVHRSWHLATSTQIDLPLKTGYPFLPELVPDVLWLEKQVERDIETCLTWLMRRKSFDEATNIAEVVNQVISEMVGQWEIEGALAVHNAFRESIRSSDVKSDLKSVPLALLALQEISVLGLSNMLAAFLQAMEQTSAAGLTETLNSIDWRYPSRVYRARLPRRVKERTEDLSSRLLFEKAVEGKVVTPDWYRYQFVSRSFVEFFEIVIPNILDAAEKAIGSDTDGHISSRQFILVGPLLDRSRDIITKCDLVVKEASKLSIELESLRRIRDEPWPNADWDEYTRRVGRLRDRSARAIAASILQLFELASATKKYPDFFGRARFTLSDEAHRCLVEGNDELFRDLFPPLLTASMLAYAAINEDTRKQRDDVRAMVSTEPIMDIVDLSGYAAIYGSLDGGSFWETVISTWDQLFGGSQDSLFVLSLVQLAIHIRDRSFSLGPFELVRWEWRMELEQRLRRDGLLSNYPFDYSRRWRGTQEPPHPSPLISALIGRSEDLRATAASVFVVEYLKKRPEAGELVLTRDAKFFEEALMHASSHGNANRDDWEAEE